MFRIITRVIVIIVVCIALGLIALQVTRASGIGYNLGSASSSQPPAVTQFSPQSDGSGPADANGTPSASASTTSLPGDTAEPGEQAEPQGQAESGEQAEPQDQELSGIVASTDNTHSEFTVKTASGAVTVLVTQQTEFSDGLTTLASVHAGMNVSVDVYRQADGHMVATDVKVSNGASDPVESNSSNSAADGN